MTESDRRATLCSLAGPHVVGHVEGEIEYVWTWRVACKHCNHKADWVAFRSNGEWRDGTTGCIKFVDVSPEPPRLHGIGARLWESVRHAFGR